MKNLIRTSAVALLTALVGYQAWGHGFSPALEGKIQIGSQSTLGQQNTPAVPVRKAKARIAVQRIYFEKDSSGVWTVVRKKSVMYPPRSMSMICEMENSYFWT